METNEVANRIVDNTKACYNISDFRNLRFVSNAPSIPPFDPQTFLVPPASSLSLYPAKILELATDYLE